LAQAQVDKLTQSNRSQNKEAVMGVTVIVFGLLISNAASPVASMTIFRGNAKKVEVKNEKLADDCGRSNPLHIQPNAAGFLQNPGAGIDPFKPFHVVLKSGYLKADCVKDYMYVHGDKFGKGKHDYKLGSSAGVSIVHYNDWVPKEDRQKMTPKVCFQFCRSVPDMGFFASSMAGTVIASPTSKPWLGTVPCVMRFAMVIPLTLVAASPKVLYIPCMPALWN